MEGKTDEPGEIMALNDWVCGIGEISNSEDTLERGLLGIQELAEMREQLLVVRDASVVLVLSSAAAFPHPQTSYLALSTVWTVVAHP